jgi:hypothetical protein
MRGFEEEHDLKVAVDHLNRAAGFYPFDYKFRNGPRRLLSQVLEQAVKRAARPQ